MKHYVALILFMFVVFGLHGCQGVDRLRGKTTLFLVDSNGFSYGGVPYVCDSMITWERTAPNGAFTFYPHDSCRFDFRGLRGDYNINPIVDDIVRIVDDTYRGQSGIPYGCASFGTSTTFYDGSFYYNMNDQCTFYL
jgi:hypothetical protein